LHTFAELAALYCLPVAFVYGIVGVFLVRASVRKHAIAALIVGGKASWVTNTSLLSILKTLHTFTALDTASKVTCSCRPYLTCTHALDKIVKLPVIAAEYECGKVLTRRMQFVITWSLMPGLGSKLAVKLHYFPSDVTLSIRRLCRDDTRA
jgi:hypothetical protein